MAKDYAGIWRKLAVTRLLWEFVLLGVVLVIAPELPIAVSAWSEWTRHSIAEFGKAFLIAGVLGLVIDRTIKNDLVRDAVSAALGYLLPERLKSELRALYDQKVLVEQIFTVRLEHFPETRTVKLHGSYNRRIENISGEKTTVRLGGGTDEWFNSQGETTIEACEYRRVKNEKIWETIEIPVNKAAIGIGYELLNVPLDADEIIEQLMSYTMYLPDHGVETLVYRYLVDRPLVNVEFPRTLHVTVSFHHRDNFGDESQSGHISKRLERILLPYQDIQILWHRRDDIDERVKKYGLKL